MSQGLALQVPMQMNLFVQKLDTWMACCIVCRGWFGRVNLVCEGCWQLYKDEMLLPTVAGLNEYPISTICLWNWNRTNDHLLRTLVYSLKGGGHKRFHRRMAYEFVVKSLALDLHIDQKTIIVPAPPRHLGQLDHAGELALALSKQLGLPVEKVLQRRDLSGRAQKAKSRSQRWQLSSEPIVQIAESLRFDKVPVLFVDDVITTGSTAQSAWKALGKPKYFEAWSLLERALVQFES